MLAKLATVLLLAASATAVAVEQRQVPPQSYQKCSWRDPNLTQEQKNAQCKGADEICIPDKSFSITMRPDGICVQKRSCGGFGFPSCAKGFHCQDMDGDHCNMTPGDGIDDDDPPAADCVGICVATSFTVIES